MNYKTYNTEFDIQEKEVVNKVYMYREPGTWGEKEIEGYELYRLNKIYPDNEKLKKIIKNVEDCYSKKEKDTDNYDRYKISDDIIVGIGQTCIETYPCHHSFELNGKRVEWNAFDCHKFFVKNGCKPPKHFIEYDDNFSINQMLNSDDY